MKYVCSFLRSWQACVCQDHLGGLISQAEESHSFTQLFALHQGGGRGVLAGGSSCFRAAQNQKVCPRTGSLGRRVGKMDCSQGNHSAERRARAYLV